MSPKSEGLKNKSKGKIGWRRIFSLEQDTAPPMDLCSLSNVSPVETGTLHQSQNKTAVYNSIFFLNILSNWSQNPSDSTSWSQSIPTATNLITVTESRYRFFPTLTSSVSAVPAKRQAFLLLLKLTCWF